MAPARRPEQRGRGHLARLPAGRSIDTATSPAAGRKTAKKVLESLHTCPIPEVAKLGRTLRQWRTEILAYFDTGGVSNGSTQAINGVIEKTRRLTHGFRNFTNYRIRILLAADDTRPYRRPPTRLDQPNEPTQADLRRDSLTGL